MHDGDIEGRGCCGGFRDASYNLNCCGLVSGQIADGHASFGFSFDQPGERYEYATDVFVSADHQRMAGTFSHDGVVAVAWVRIGANDPLLPYLPSVLPDTVDAATGDYGLVLADGVSPGSDFDPQRVYRFRPDGRYIRGDLGPFWTGELSWHAEDQTLVAGPVSETIPGLPVGLSLHYDGATLTSVDATMASGIRYHFQASPWQP